MDTLFETDDYSVKKIFMKKGSQSSLEYHVKKVESYYIDSGKLKVGLTQVLQDESEETELSVK